MPSSANKPLRSIRELSAEILWENYDFSDAFQHLCTLRPNADKEALEISAVHESAKMKEKGVVYVLVVAGRIFKIGQSINTFKSRMGSYNSGRTEYRIRGTCSGANYFALQSFIKLGKPVEVYAYWPVVKEWRLFGEQGSQAFPSSKTVEGIVTRRFERKYGKLPIGNGQR